MPLLSFDRIEPVSDAALPPSAVPAAPLVIAHGLFGAKRNWASLARRFAARRPVITVDMRNHGESFWAAETSYPAMAADLLAVISAEAGGRAALLGHSMGGKAAMAAALQNPDAVAGLIVADIAPVAYPDHPHGQVLQAMRALPLRPNLPRRDLDPLLADAVPEASLRAFILQNIIYETAAEGRLPKWRLNLDALAEAIDALTGWPDAFAAASGRRYGGETLFFHGGASDYVAPTARPAIEALFPHASVQSLPGAGHWLHAEQPDAFFAGAEAWLTDHGL